MAFEKFTRTGGRGYSPKVSIWSRGQIGFNHGAVRKFNINSFKYAMLFYDKDNKKIGIKFVNEEEDGTLKLINRVGGGASLSATAFLHFYSIEHSETKKYNITHDKEKDLYIIDINENT